MDFIGWILNVSNRYFRGATAYRKGGVLYKVLHVLVLIALVVGVLYLEDYSFSYLSENFFLGILLIILFVICAIVVLEMGCMYSLFGFISAISGSLDDYINKKQKKQNKNKKDKNNNQQIIDDNSTVIKVENEQNQNNEYGNESANVPSLTESKKLNEDNDESMQNCESKTNVQISNSLSKNSQTCDNDLNLSQTDGDVKKNEEIKSIYDLEEKKVKEKKSHKWLDLCVGLICSATTITNLVMIFVIVGKYI